MFVVSDINSMIPVLCYSSFSATFTQNEVIFSDVLHASDQMYPTRVLRMHLEDELDNVLREQILERERAGKNNGDSGSDSEPEDSNDATGAGKHERLVNSKMESFMLHV